MKRNDMKVMPMEAVLLFILAKIDQYKGEIEFFENKYKQDFYQVEREAHSARGKEDFQLEENLEDWEFAIKSLGYWEKRITSLEIQPTEDTEDTECSFHHSSFYLLNNP